MQRRPRVEMEPRLSWRFFPSQQGYGPTSHEFMFTRDVPLGIMPFRGSRDRPGYAVRLEPHDKEVADWLPGFLHIGQYEQDTLDEAIVDFVEAASRYLAHSGEAYLELIGALGNSRFRYAQLGPLPPGRVLRVHGKYFQVIPRPDRARAEGKRWNAVPSERMWHVSLPRELGSPRAHRRLLRRVRRLGEVTPTFVFESTDLGRSVGYDFNMHRAACDVETERATNRWGTIPSFGRVKSTTEYFLFSRRLQWKRAQALVREHLLFELNQLLRRLSVRSELVVEGLPAPEQLAETIRKLHRGEVTVEEAMAMEPL